MHTLVTTPRCDNEIHDDVMRSMLDEPLSSFTALPEELDLPPLEFSQPQPEQFELDQELYAWEARKACRELLQRFGSPALEQVMRDLWAESNAPKLDEFGKCQWRIYRLTMALGDARGQMEKLLHA